MRVSPLQLKPPARLRCYACKRVKPVEEFPRDRSKSVGRKYLCRVCDNAKAQVYYEQNRARVLEKDRVREAAKRSLRPVKLCERCGLVPVSHSRAWYCDHCRVIRLKERHHRPGRPKRNHTALGWGSDHQKERQAWVPVVATGTVRCARGTDCFFAEWVGGVRVGGLIDPGERWHLDHTDDRTGYLGPSHVRCNCATAGRRRDAA